jgi:hypothetical protein
MALLLFRQTLVAVFVNALMIGATQCETLFDPAGKTPAELARAVAHTIDLGFPKNGNGPVHFDGALSHDNVVDVQLTIDRERMTKLKSSLDDQQRGQIAYFCKDQPRQFIDAGVVIHVIHITPDGSERVETSIDKRTCANPPPPPALADIKTLSAKAQAVARAELEQATSHRSANDVFHLEGAAAKGNVVEMNFVVTDQNFGRGVAADSARFRSGLLGHACGTYGDDLRRGLSIHQVFRLMDGSPILEVTFNNSSC